jgi:hypothetical protein
MSVYIDKDTGSSKLARTEGIEESRHAPKGGAKAHLEGASRELEGDILASPFPLRKSAWAG